MEMIYYIRLLKRNLIFIILLAVTGTAFSALFYNYLVPVQYESSITLWVTKTKSSEQLLPVELTVGPQLIKDFKKLVKSSDFINQVRAELPTNNPAINKLDNNSFRKHLIIESKPYTRVFSIGFTSVDPHAASLVARVAERHFEEQVNTLFQIDNILVVNNGDFTADVISPTTQKVALLAAIIWSAAALMMVLFIDLIKKEDKYENILDRS